MSTGFAEQQTGGPRQERAFGSYLAAIRAHPGVVALITLAAVAASVAFLATRSDRYEATADVLVNAVPQEDQTFLGIPVLRDSGDPVRTVQTAASLIASREAADLAAERMGKGWDADRVLDSVEVAPRGESNVLGITATAGSPEEAAELANQFMRASLDVRAELIADAAETALERLDARAEALAAGDPARFELAERRDALQTVVAEGDPTLSLSQEAIPPTSALGAPPALVVLLALIAGFVLGSGTAMLLKLLAHRVRDPVEGLELYPLPVLARVPEVSTKRLEGPEGTTWHMPPEIREPFRTLALQLDQRTGATDALMITSATSGDGKTTSAINLAVSLAATGKEVALLDFDLRNPQVGAALGISGGYAIRELLDPRVRLDELLFRASELSSLRVLPLVASGNEAGLIDAGGMRLPRLLEQAKSLVDHVVIDTAPLGEVGDALRIVPGVDDIFLVMRPGNTDRAHLAVVRELLEGVGLSATGYVLIGRVEGGTRGYYAYGEAVQERTRAFLQSRGRIDTDGAGANGGQDRKGAKRWTGVRKRSSRRSKTRNPFA